MIVLFSEALDGNIGRLIRSWLIIQMFVEQAPTQIYPLVLAQPCPMDTYWNASADAFVSPAVRFGA
jgi:hypothetical protein